MSNTHREMDRIDRETAEGNPLAAVMALNDGSLMRAARADNRARRAQTRARVQSQMDDDGFMAVADLQRFYGVKRGNTVRLTRKKGDWVVISQATRSGIRVAPAKYGPLRAARFGDPGIPSHVIHTVQANDVTHVLMSARYR